MTDQRDFQEAQEAEDQEIMRVLSRIEKDCGAETALNVARKLGLDFDLKTHGD